MTPLERVVQGVGVASLVFGTAGVLAPRRLAGAFGVRPTQAPVLPLLVRFAASRQLALGAALLTRSPVPVGRSARLFLPVTAVDAAAAVVGHRQGLVGRRALVFSGAVLVTNVAVAAQSR